MVDDQIMKNNAVEATESSVPPAMDSFLRALSIVLEHMVLVGEPDGTAIDCSGTHTRFHGVKPPSISVYQYLKRIESHFKCSSECFVIALVYIDRLVKAQGPKFVITSCAIHRVALTSIVLAAKFFDDRYYSNRFYAAVGGVRTKELNLLEADFLRLINWDLHIIPEEYEAYRLSVWTAVTVDMMAVLSPPPPPPTTPSSPCRLPLEMILRSLVGVRASSVAPPLRSQNYAESFRVVPCTGPCTPPGAYADRRRGASIIMATSSSRTDYSTSY